MFLSLFYFKVSNFTNTINMYSYDESTSTPDLCQLVSANNYDQVALMLIKDTTASCRLGPDGRSPLMVAAGMPNLDLVKVLVELGAADPNQLSYVRGDTALFFAVQARSLPIVFYLICVGGRLLKNREGTSPLDWAVDNLAPNDRLRLVLEQLQTAGIKGFGLPNRRTAVAGSLGPPPCTRHLSQAKEEDLLVGLRGFSLVDETESDLVIGGLLPYVFRGSTFSTPVITYISKKAVPELFGKRSFRSSDEEIGRRNPATESHLMNSREALYRCVIDLSQANGLILSRKASYLDPLSGVVRAPLVDVNASRNVAEYLITIVTELFQTAPPLVQKPVYVPTFGEERHADPTEPPLSSSSSTVNLKTHPPIGPYLRAVALTCSKFHKGRAMRTVPKEGIVVGVVPIRCDGVAAPSQTATADDAPATDTTTSPKGEDEYQPSLYSLGVTTGVVNPEYDHFVRFTELDDQRRQIEKEDGVFDTRRYTKEEALAIFADLEGASRTSQFPGFNFSIPVRIELHPSKSEDGLPPIPIVKVIAPPGAFFVSTPSCSVQTEGGVQVGIITTPIIRSKAVWEREYTKDPLNVFKHLLEELQSLLGREPPLRGEAAPEDQTVKKKKKKGLFGGLFK